MHKIETRSEADQTYADWECTVCGSMCMWSFMDVAEMGTPVCPECDSDMSIVLYG